MFFLKVIDDSNFVILISVKFSSLFLEFLFNIFGKNVSLVIFLNI